MNNLFLYFFLFLVQFINTNDNDSKSPKCEITTDLGICIEGGY